MSVFKVGQDVTDLHVESNIIGQFNEYLSDPSFSSPESYQDFGAGYEEANTTKYHLPHQPQQYVDSSESSIPPLVSHLAIIYILGVIIVNLFFLE